MSVTSYETDVSLFPQTLEHSKEFKVNTECFLSYVPEPLNKPMYYGADAQYVLLAGWKINEFPLHESAQRRLDVPSLCSCLMQWLLLQQERGEK